MAHEMIHGGGSDYNTGNRWFDKTMQVIFFPDFRPNFFAYLKFIRLFD